MAGSLPLRVMDSEAKGTQEQKDLIALVVPAPLVLLVISSHVGCMVFVQRPCIRRSSGNGSVSKP